MLTCGAFNFENGTDYSFLRSARKLSNNEFTFHPQLGYISLQQRLRNDEILAVAYEYTYNGQVFKVGELTEDYQNKGANDAIFIKLLGISINHLYKSLNIKLFVKILIFRN